MQYIVDDQYYLADDAVDKLRPILFYTGNEGGIWDFYENSGFMTTVLAKEFGGLVVFGEHRYFGDSWPYPQDVALQSPYNQYLTIENVMADYAHLLNYIKIKYDAQE